MADLQGFNQPDGSHNVDPNLRGQTIPLGRLPAPLWQSVVFGGTRCAVVLAVQRLAIETGKP